MDKEKKITWNDLHNATPQELKKHYGLTERQLEKGVRRHLYSGTQQQMTKFFQKFYGRKS